MASNQETVFRCPCCGGVFTVERLNTEAPFPFEETVRTFGGKEFLTDLEREWRDLESKGRGSGHGIIVYGEWGPPDPDTIEAFKRRIVEVQNDLAG